MRAVAANLSAREDYLESEMRFNLFPELLERLAEEFFHFAAAQANNMRMFLLHARFVVMLVAANVHQVELVNQPALFQHLQRSVNGNAIQLRIALLGHDIQALGVQVLAGFVNKLEQYLPLAREADAALS